MKKQLLSIMLAGALALGLVACGDDDSSKSSKKKDKEETVSTVDTAALEAMAGEYECTFVIVNIYADDAGYKSSDIEAQYMGSTLTISGEKMDLAGNSNTISPAKSDNLYYNYLVTVKESGYNDKASHSGRKYASADFDGPAWFMYAAAGTDQGFGAIEKDTIELYYSPAGTEDWYWTLTYTKK